MIRRGETDSSLRILEPGDCRLQIPIELPRELQQSIHAPAARVLGGPPTGHAIEFTGIAMCVVRDGRIVEGWNSFDFLSMYQQIGWIGNPPLP